MYIERKVSSEEEKDKLRDKRYVLIIEFIYIHDEYNHSFRIRKEQRKRKRFRTVTQPLSNCATGYPVIQPDIQLHNRVRHDASRG